MQPRTTGLLLLVAAGLAAFVYLYEIEGEDERADAEQRGKRIFAGVEAADVAWIELRTSDGADARLEQRDGAWHLARPLDFPADAVAERMAESLATLVHEAVIESPQPDAEYGLDEASARIVRFGAGDEARELRLGDPTPVGPNVYARRGEAGVVYTVPSLTADAFAYALADLREKQVLDFDAASVRGVEARWPGGRVRVGRDAADADWKLLAPLETDADGAAVDRLLSTLAFLRADAFDDAPSPERLALFDAPDFALTLRREGDAAPLELAVSRPDGQGQRWVRSKGDVLHRIHADRIDDFPRRVVAWRDRTLASFSAIDAQAVDFFFQNEAGDPVVVRGERTSSGWTSEPEAFASGRLSGAIVALSRLVADDVVAESMGPTELEELGFSPPVTVISVFGKRPESGEGSAESDPLPVLAELHLGRLTPDGVVARVAGEPVVWRLGLDTVAQIPIGLENFRTHFRESDPADAPPPEPDGELTLSTPAGELTLPTPAGESP